MRHKPFRHLNSLLMNSVPTACCGKDGLLQICITLGFNSVVGINERWIRAPSIYVLSSQVYSVLFKLDEVISGIKYIN